MNAVGKCVHLRILWIVNEVHSEFSILRFFLYLYKICKNEWWSVEESIVLCSGWAFFHMKTIGVSQFVYLSTIVCYKYKVDM